MVVILGVSGVGLIATKRLGKQLCRNRGCSRCNKKRPTTNKYLKEKKIKVKMQSRGLCLCFFFFLESSLKHVKGLWASKQNDSDYISSLINISQQLRI